MSVRIFMTWKKPGYFTSRAELCWATGQNSLKIIKPGLSRESQK